MTVRLDLLPPASWADATADDLAARIRAATSLRLCLPTGDTPQPLYEALVAASLRRDVSFEHVELLLLDEYVGLEPGDPGRCDTRLRRELVDRLEPPPAAFHTIEVDGLDPAPAAALHDAVAAAGIDLALVGLGMNGHIGFNEPGSTAASTTRPVEIAASSRRKAVEQYGARAEPTGGITLGLDRILAAGEVWLLVTGERKAGILARTLEGPIGPDVPASFLRRHPRLRVIADGPAAALLRQPR